jgi:hypothetical protein
VDPQSSHDRVRPPCRLADSGQVDERCPVQPGRPARGQHPPRDLDRQPGLADAAWPDQRDQAHLRLAEQGDDGSDLILSADDRGQRHRERRRRLVRRRNRPGEPLGQQHGQVVGEQFGQLVVVAERLVRPPPSASTRASICVSRGWRSAAVVT